MAAHNDTGKWGEDLAVAYLEKKGYTIVERDWKSGRRDIDIIALDDDVVVFVEVKTRRNRLFGDPEESVDYHKLQNLQQAISHYVKFKHIRQEIRFDIISVVGTIGSEPDIQHIQNVALL
ncbi:MAG: YraN family protein [Prevotella sp.]|nr:YraN family protein [Prevotella sp.]